MKVSLKKINAIFQLKLQLLLGNMSVILTPVFAIGFVLIMKNLIPEVNVEEEGVTFLTGAFLLGFGLIFNIGIGGVSMSSHPIAEEKEKNTLRVLMTSSVNGVEYFIGSMLPTLIILMLVNVLLIPVSGIAFGDIQMPTYLLITAAASIISILIGYIIGIVSKNQTQAGLVGMPILLVLTSAPLFRIYNEMIADVLNYTYAGVLTNLSQGLFSGGYEWSLLDSSVLIGWFVVCLGLFVYVYKRNGLDR
ncbi:ABC transporter permease [Jeotgalibacillus proteolyticus]|uniref:ABC transporter permease n=1 Tax=Jeotgalibacillus proteolyticus TaxID=2082395 RepID=A0A2S5GA67_9BACL|nr:ABC transporter permease [Jeotgalibacillus proteolyticus]PPA69815.1 ABC transporter permease [Jeotgalibacillus proteolyticus]